MREKKTDRKDLFLLVWVIYTILTGCDYTPWRKQRYDSQGAVLLVKNIVGVYFPELHKVYGCQWEEVECYGFWIQNISTGELIPVRDTDRMTGDFTVSVDGEYLIYASFEWDSLGVLVRTYYRIQVNNPNQIVDSIVGVPGGGAVPSPRDPEIYYVASPSQWEEVEVLWRLDFKRDTFVRETSVTFPKGVFIIPGKLRDSVVVMDGLGTLQPVEYTYERLAVDFTDRRFLVIMNYRTGERYLLDIDLSTLEKDAIFSGVEWIQGYDSLLIDMEYLGGFGLNPQEIHTWLIPNVSERLIPLDETKRR